MGAGNKAVFNGTINGSGQVNWSTNFQSLGDAVGAAAFQEPCTFNVANGQDITTVASTLASAFAAKHKPNYGATASGGTVTFTAKGGNPVVGMTVEGNPLSATDPTYVFGTSGMTVTEPDS